jgi:hypothetical protein
VLRVLIARGTQAGIRHEVGHGITRWFDVIGWGRTQRSLWVLNARDANAGKKGASISAKPISTGDRKFSCIIAQRFSREYGRALCVVDEG